MTVVNIQGFNLPQRAFEESGLRHPKIAVKTSYLPLRDQMVASSNLLGLSSRRLLRQIAKRLNVVELPVPELMRRRCVAVSYRKDAYLSPAARRLIAILKTTALEMAANDANLARLQRPQRETHPAGGRRLPRSWHPNGMGGADRE